MMNLIDISSWQSGMNLSTMFSKNPDLDGVIVKVTQGLSYVNPPAKAWLDWLTKNGKPFGVYHYLDLYGAKEEAQHFVDVAKPYVDKGILVADYEGNTVRKGAGYLKEFLDEVYRLTGVKAWVYCSQSIVANNGFGAIAEAGHPLWMAQYADYNPVKGFLEHPWQKGSVAPFSKYWLLQYTSCGYLDGWSDRLDLDLFYGDVSDWARLSGKEAPTPTPEPTPALKPATPEIVLRILHNDFGTGDERIAKIKAEGYDPVSCQTTINRLYQVAGKLKTDIGNDMPYLNCLLWILRS